MKYLLSTIFIVVTFSLSAQNFVDAEVNALAEEIASKIDAKNNILPNRKRYNIILVEDFTDTEGNVSKLGASLAEEFSLALSSAGISYSVTGAKDLITTKKSGGIRLDKVLSGVAKVVDGVTDDSNYEANRRNREVVRSMDGANDIVNSIQKDKERYKGIDAVVAGTLTESNDQYGILIKVISTGKNYEMITNAKGFITKTPFILALEEEENKRIQNMTAGTKSPGSSGSIRYGGGLTSSGEVQVTNNTKVELLEIKQVGQKIECSFQITNIGPDIEFNMYGFNSGGKLIDGNNSYDYFATQIQLGELIDKYSVKKTLVTNNSTIAKITYGAVAREVSEAAKLTVRCYGHGGYFWIEFRDVIVE